MREILFRGKRKDNGEFVYGLPFSMHASNKVEGIETFDGERHVIIPKTMGQYTGRRDRFWHKIYENDIVIYEWGNRAVLMEIVFGDGEFRMRPLKEYPFETWEIRITDEDYLEKIGNIYDNPELIGGTE